MRSIARGLILLLAAAGFIALPAFWSKAPEIAAFAGWNPDLKLVAGLIGIGLYMWMLFALDRSLAKPIDPNLAAERMMSPELRRIFARMDVLNQEIKAATPALPSQQEMAHLEVNLQALADFERRMNEGWAKRERLSAEMMQLSSQLLAENEKKPRFRPLYAILGSLKNDRDRELRVPAIATGILFAILAGIAVISR